jgi:methyl-accepting chemotaxis protein
MFSNLKLMSRLMLSFALVALGTPIVAIVGIRALAAILEADEVSYTKLTVPMESLIDMSVALQGVRVENREMLLAETAEARERSERRVSELFATFDKAAAEFDRTLIREKVREAMKETLVDIKSFREVSDRVRNLAAAGKKEEARALMNGEGGAISSRAQESLKKITGLKMETAKLNFEANSERSSSARTAVTLMCLAAVLVALGLGFVIARSVTEPLRRATEIAESGDLSARLNIVSNDEVGRLSKAFDAMTERLEKKTREAETIAQGDLTLEVEVASEQDSLGKAFRTMVENLRKLVTDVRGAFTGVTTGATEISDASQSLSQGATEQASSLEEITSSMTEVASQSKISSENAEQASHLASSARESAQQGSQLMQLMVEAMNDINGSSQQIAKIIKVIDDIAFQTNLLALNAAVEAARAGKHGKGFAVVAEEVRNLASRSAKAARETAELIDASGKKVQNGLQVAQGTSGSFEAIVANVVKAADLVGEIAAASKEQAAGIGQISQGLTQIDQVTQRNTASAEETASAAQELSSSASKIEQLFGRFHVSSGGPAPTKAASGKRRANGKRPPAKVAASALAPASSDWGNGAALAKRAPEAPPSSKGGALQPQDVIALDDQEFGRY